MAKMGLNKLDHPTPDTNCEPKDLALKSFFLGPQAENRHIVEQALKSITKHWLEWRQSLFKHDGVGISTDDQADPEFNKRMVDLLTEVEQISKSFHHELPKYSPRYIGHMFSETSIPGLIGHFIALLYNPNNISHEVSTVGIELEQKAVRALADMIGYAPHTRGHFTSGGTIANFEMLFRAKQIWKMRVAQKVGGAFARSTEWSGLSDFDFIKKINQAAGQDLRPPVLLLPASAHYSWVKGMSLIGLGENQILRLPLNKYGQIDPHKFRMTLEKCLQENIPLLGLVSILGTTELGSFDPINELAAILDNFLKNENTSVWHHVDAAYGGFFAAANGIQELVQQNPKLTAALQALPRTSSITIDPHKLGYVPYSSGCFLCQDPDYYMSVSTAAPYINYKDVTDPGPFTIEGSRSAAGSVATLLSSRTIGFNQEGLGRIILRAMNAATELREQLTQNQNLVLEPDYEHTNIVCFAVTGEHKSLKSVNAKTRALLDRMELHNQQNPQNAFYVSKTKLLKGQSAIIENFCAKYNLQQDDDQLYLIRCTVMNPFLISRHSRTDYIAQFCKHVHDLAGTKNPVAGIT